MKPTGDQSASLLVLAADSVRARLFSTDHEQGPLEEILALSNPEARLHEGDLVEDTAGRRGTRPTQAKHSAFGGESAKRHRAEEFAGRLCKHLARQLAGAGERRLYIVAEPEFLGLLRQRMDRSVERSIVAEIPRSLTTKPPEEIRAVLPQRL